MFRALRKRNVQVRWLAMNYGARVGSNAVIYGILGINALVFIEFNRRSDSERRFQKMLDHFTVSVDNVRSGRIWVNHLFIYYNFKTELFFKTMVTSAFAHFELSHFAVNSFVLYSFGKEVCKTLGPARFLRFYLLGAISSSALSLAFHASDPKLHKVRSLGASGAINSTVVLSACLFPYSYINIFMIMPVPARIAAGLFVGYDFVCALSEKNSRVDNAGHLGGAIFGYLYYTHLFKYF
jgi:membrane associated rhomboid family serine protease